MGFVSCIQMSCNQSQTQPVLKIQSVSCKTEPPEQTRREDMEGKGSQKGAMGATSSSQPPPRALPSPCARAFPAHPALALLTLTGRLLLQL